MDSFSWQEISVEEQKWTLENMVVH